MFERIEKIMAELEEAEQVYNSDLPPEMKYGILLTHQMETITPALMDIGIVFSWPPNDNNYMREAKRYIASLSEIRKRLCRITTKEGIVGFKHAKK